jgi:hypothetical protein
VYKFTYEKSTSVVVARAGGAPTLDAMVIKPVFGRCSLSRSSPLARSHLLSMPEELLRHRQIESKMRMQKSVDALTSGDELN